MTVSIEQAFRARGRHAALVTYIMAGDPTLEASGDFALTLQAAGADILELGVPFSDPIADGPVIQAAGQRALASGASLRKVLDLAASLRGRGLTIPVVLMGYANPIMRFGFDAFARAAAGARVNGVIVPDLPADEGGDLAAALAQNGVDAVQLAAPTSDDARLRYVAGESRGFLYYVSLTGVTGMRDSLPADVGDRIRRVQQLSPLPVAVGFGVSNPEMARALGKIARGVVVGSALVKLVEQHGAGAAPYLKELTGRLRAALDEVEVEAAPA